MELPKVRSSTSRGRLGISLPAPLTRSLNGLPPRLPPPTVARRSTIERLAKPKQAQEGYGLPPDRPSVYWLDYLIDPRPHQMKDPHELASYYEEFEPRFPRTRLLSAPKTVVDIAGKEVRTRSTVSQKNVPVSALNYKASDRIKDIARPRTTVPSPRFMSWNINTSRNMSASKVSATSIERRQNNNGKELSLDNQRHKGDFSRGDFSSTTQFNYHRIN